MIFCLYDIDETPRTIGISSLDGMITSSYKIMKCYQGILPKFIYYLYLSIDEIKGLKSFYTGLRNVVRPETFMNLKIILPPYEIQEKIVNQLDEKNLLFSQSIQNYKDSIKLIEEQRLLSFEQIVKGVK